MKLSIRNYAPLTIPEELLVPMQKPFKADTPYVTKIAARWKSKGYINKKLPLKIMCLESIRDRAFALGGYQIYSDPMAGIGISARVFGWNARLKVARLNDLDEGCRKVIAHNFHQSVSGDDIFTSRMHNADLVFLDFNDYTMKRAMGKYAPVVEKAAASSRKFLVINDCSPFYFRYGKSSFKVYSKLLGCKINSVEDYFRAVRPFYRKLGFSLIQVNYFSETSFLLLSRTADKLRLRRMNDVVIPSGFVSASS